MKMSAVRTDARASAKGKWFDWVEGVRLLIASANSPRYAAETERLAMERAVIKKLEDPEAIQLDVRRAAAKCLLLGWEGIEDDNGQPIPYSVKQALDWLTDDECFELYRFVRDKSQDIDSFKKEKAVAKN